MATATVLPWIQQTRRAPNSSKPTFVTKLSTSLLLLGFSSNLLLLVWSLLEKKNLGLLSNLMNPWGSCGNADSD